MVGAHAVVARAGKCCSSWKALLKLAPCHSCMRTSLVMQNIQTYLDVLSYMIRIKIESTTEGTGERGGGSRMKSVKVAQRPSSDRTVRKVG